MLGAALSLEHRTAWVPWAYHFSKRKTFESINAEEIICYKSKVIASSGCIFFFTFSFNFPDLQFRVGEKQPDGSLRKADPRK